MPRQKRASKLSVSSNNGAGDKTGPPSGFVALSLLLRPDPSKMPNPKDGPPCHLCTARCCKYFALPIDTPTAHEDYEHIRWYLMHEGVAVWMDDGDWYIEIRTVCKHLQPDNSCGIYETRPQICRDYGTEDEEGPCEFFTDDLKYDLYFESDDAFAVWVAAESDKKKQRNARQRERRRKRVAARRTVA